jgi:hypothetical protein
VAAVRSGQPAVHASSVQIVTRGAAVVAVALAGITTLGFVQTASFNVTLGRIAPFDQESPIRWIEFGIRALVLPGVYMIGLFVAVAAARFALRVLSLSRGIERLLTTSVSKTTRLGARLGLDDPLVLAQAVAAAGFVLLGAILWRYWGFILAWGSASISTQPAERFFPLRLGRPRLDAQLYVLALTAVLFFFGAAISRIQRLRARQTILRAGPALAIVVTMALVTVLLLEVPYRVEWQNKMPRLDVAGERCYAIGEQRDQRLVYCPDRTPPRNRIIRRDDPAARDLGVVENIFTPPETSPQ